MKKKQVKSKLNRRRIDLKIKWLGIIMKWNVSLNTPNKKILMKNIQRLKLSRKIIQVRFYFLRKKLANSKQQMIIRTMNSKISWQTTKPFALVMNRNSDYYSRIMLHLGRKFSLQKSTIVVKLLGSKLNTKTSKKKTLMISFQDMFRKLGHSSQKSINSTGFFAKKIKKYKI